MSMERLNKKPTSKVERPDAANENFPQGNGVDAIHEMRVQLEQDRDTISPEEFARREAELDKKVLDMYLDKAA